MCTVHMEVHKSGFELCQVIDIRSVNVLKMTFVFYNKLYPYEVQQFTKNVFVTCKLRGKNSIWKPLKSS